MRERERKRKKNRKEVRERTERVTETETLIILSSCSPWWWGSPQKIIESSGWIYAQARWECPGENAQVLPQARGSLTVSCLLQQSLDLLQYFRGSLMDYDTSSAASHVNVPWMWPVGWGFHSCEGGWGWGWALHHTPETSSTPLAWEVCANLASESCGLYPPKPSQGWFSAAFGFLMDAFFSFSLVYFSLDPRMMEQ